MEKICSICNSTFNSKFKVQKFCSPLCARTNRYPKRTKICTYCKCCFITTTNTNNNLFCSIDCFNKKRSIRIKTICKFCHATIECIPSRIKIYCDKICKYSDLSNKRKSMTGSKNPVFKHGKSRSNQYRKLAFENFPNECFVCKKKNKRLEVHHIDHNERNDDIKNLMILCCSCHIKHHRGSLLLP